MVAKGKKPTSAESATKVTRIKAADTKTPKKKDAKASASKAKAAPVTAEPREKRRTPWKATADYFGGAWYELKQVRWPNRRATWSMTAALLGFTAFFVVFILLLDFGFKNLFELILG